MTDRVLCEMEGGIARVTLNRPDKYNGLDMPMFDALAATARKLRKDRSVRVVILEGAGQAFCSGLDVKSVTSNPINFFRLLMKPGFRIANRAQEVGYLWRQVPAPVIAVTQGVCFGGGLQIALGADFRFSTPDCEFSIMEAKWGLIPDMGLTTSLPELMPVDQAKRLAMTAARIDGREALALNLVTELAEDPWERARAFAGELMEKSPDAVAGVKLLFNNAWLADDRTSLGWESRLQKKIIGRANQRIAVARNTSDPERSFNDRREF